MTYGAMINGQELWPKDLNINGINFLRAKDDAYVFRKGNAILTVENLQIDRIGKQVSFTMNGRSYQIQIQDQVDQIINQLGYSQQSETGNNSIKAPMPGLVLEIMIDQGMEVEKGDPLLILEAMKMENVIKSPMDGIVKSIKIGKSDSVDKHQLLIELEG